MPLHIMKLCVGCASIEELIAWINFTLTQKQAQRETIEQLHTTRMVPRRMGKLHDNSSLYWIIKGNIQCRQRLIDIRPFTDKEEINRCHLILEPKVIATEWQPRRAFQGWRYLNAEDAPRDENDKRKNRLPASILQELAELGLL